MKDKDKFIKERLEEFRGQFTGHEKKATALEDFLTETIEKCWKQGQIDYFNIFKGMKDGEGGKFWVDKGTVFFIKDSEIKIGNSQEPKGNVEEKENEFKDWLQNEFTEIKNLIYKLED